MAYLKYARPNFEKKRVELGIADDDGQLSRYSVGLVFYSHIGEPAKGAVVDESLLSLIISEDEQYRAMKKALSLLSYSDKSRKMLYSRLIGLGYGRASATEAVNECMRLGYIDEREQIIRFVKREANVSLKGRALIIKKGIAKGFKSADIASVIDELCDEGEIDFKESLRRLAEKKGALSEEEISALAYKNGYTGGGF